MFQPSKNISEHESGYKLVIYYNKAQNRYSITGYVTTQDKNNVMHSVQDGETLFFDTMEAVMASIADYPDR